MMPSMILLHYGDNETLGTSMAGPFGGSVAWEFDLTEHCQQTLISHSGRKMYQNPAKTYILHTVKGIPMERVQCVNLLFCS